LHHAYLFTGTRGVGKTTISRILAKSLNCTGPDGQGTITARPCGVCMACTDIDAGRFIDYVELDAASNRGVDEITQLLDQAVYKPVVGRFKVYMIDEVHMLSNHAFNAMLKTLEEPPEYLKFVLATTDPQKVPATVLSRCLQFNLRPMAPQTVQEHLADVLAREGLAAEPGALRLLSRAARGSMRDALSLTDQAIAFGAGALVETSVRQMLGAVDRGHAVRIAQAWCRGDGAALVAAVDALRALGLSAAGTLEEIASLLQQVAVLQVTPQAYDEADPDRPDALRLASQMAADEVQLLYSMALHGRAELALAPDEYSGAVMVLLRMLAFRPPSDDSSPASVASPGRDAGPAAHRAGPVAAATQPAAVAAPVRPVAVPPGGARASAAPAPAQPAAMAAAPALRVAPPAPTGPAAALDDADPAPWLQAPFEDEEGVAVRSASPPVRAAAPALRAAAVYTPTALGERWARLVATLHETGRVSALAREAAMQAQCLVLDEQADPIVCQLRVERENLRAPALVDKLRQALTQTLGRAVDLRVEPGVAEDSAALRDAAVRAQRQSEAERVIRDDPLVRALMAQYQTARIVPGSVKPQ